MGEHTHLLTMKFAHSKHNYLMDATVVVDGVSRPSNTLIAGFILHGRRATWRNGRLPSVRRSFLQHANNPLQLTHNHSPHITISNIEHIVGHRYPSSIHLMAVIFATRIILNTNQYRLESSSTNHFRYFTHRWHRTAVIIACCYCCCALMRMLLLLLNTRLQSVDHTLTGPTTTLQLFCNMHNVLEVACLT